MSLGFSQSTHLQHGTKWRISSTPIRSVSYYSRAPLNYETFLARIRSKPPSSIDPHTLIADCICAARALQTQTKAHSPKKSAISEQVLGLKTATPGQIERTLWKFLTSPGNESLFTSSDVLVKQYVTHRPRPSNFSHLSKLCEDNFRSKLVAAGPVDTSVFYTVLGALLDQKNYYNVFVLVENTIGSSSSLEAKRYRLVRSIVAGAAASVTIGALQAILMPLTPFWLWVGGNLAMWSSVGWGLVRANAFTQLSRVRWRSYNSMWHNYIHQEEMVAINKIITHYEEHNEVNVRNFHHSEVRKESSINMFDHNEFVLELPVSEDGRDPEMDRLQTFFKTQLYKKKMVLNELEEELRFLEFWLTHGESFTWVEPDQDPGEIMKLQIANQRTGSSLLLPESKKR